MNAHANFAFNHKSLSLFILSFSFLLMLSACSHAPAKDETWQHIQIYKKLNALRKEYSHQNQVTYGIGSGQTPEEAIQNARIDLANQILTLVQKKTRQNLQVMQSQSGETVTQNYRRQQNIQSATFSSVELENTKVIQQQQLYHTYFAVVGADADTIAKIKAKAKRTAATLVAINQFQQAQTIAEKIQWIEQGLKTMRQFHIEDETLLLAGDRYTFEAWFQQQIQTLLKQIQTATTKDNQVYAIYFLDAHTLDPIPSINVKVNQNIGYTDKLGRFVVATLPQSTQIQLLLNGQPYLLNTFIQGSRHSTLYVNTQPKGFVAELKENQQTIASITTPEAIPLEINEGHIYTLIIHRKGQYPRLQKILSLTPGFDAVFYKAFEKLTFGSLTLKLSSEDDEIKVTSPKGQRLFQGLESYHNPRLQVGTYQVQVQKANHDPEYQIVDDQFVLAKDHSIKRRYFSPQYRQFYRKGDIWSFGFIVGGSPNDQAVYQTSQGKKSGQALNYDPTTAGYNIAYRHFNTFTFLGGGVGMVSTSDNTHSIYGQTELTGFPLSAMAGVYHSFDGNLLLLEGGYRRLDLSQSNNSTQKLETDISSPFVGMHYFFSGFQLGVRYFTEQNSTLAFYINWGGNRLESGYKLPLHVQAKPGEHYEDIK